MISTDQTQIPQIHAEQSPAAVAFLIEEIAMNERPPLDPTVDIPPSGDDLDAGLAAAFGPDSGPPLPAGGSVLQALSAGLPSVPRILLREPDSFGGSPIVRPSSKEMPDKQEATARLQLHGEIARGGMGAVLKGRDADLGRDVAVKVLLETHQGKTEMLQRFVEEAQISGQLQHPGITPVYELGQFADKRPYFTMKLVKGKTLATLLAARKSPAEEQSRYVGIFAQICQTLAYAHARGVIHRDLKPSNVMVGAFGEVQVMDWGLAKVLKEGGIADEQKAQEHAEVSVIRTQRSDGSSTPEVGSNTQAGTVLGTPAYMAPEQARGHVDLVDERADVFGLGAILCAILTGQPPYVGKPEEIAYKARKAKLEDAFARLDACGADAELIGLTKHCLAAELLERPRHAGEVAQQVTAYQQSVAERLRQAELAETEARARAEEESKTRAQAEARLSAERQARRMTLGLAAAVLVSLTLAGGGGVWYQQQVAARRQEEASREAELREAVRAALDKVADLRQRARWDEARAVLEQVRQRLGPTAPEDLRDPVKQAEADLASVDRLDAARLKASVWVGSHFDYASAVRQYGAAFREAGIIGEETEAAEVVADRIRVSAVREQLVAAVDDWAWRVGEGKPPRRSWLLAVARAADPDPWRDRYRDAKVWQDRTALERLAQEAKVNELSPQILDAFGLLLGKLGGDAIPLLTAAQRRYPSDFWLNVDLGNAMYETKRWEEAIGYFRAALALRPEIAAVYNNLGLACYKKGRLDEAITECKRAIELDPKLAYAHDNLGIALWHKGRVDEAIAEYQKALGLDPKLANAHTNFGTALEHKGRIDEAIAEYKRAIELDSKLAMAHSNLGTALKHKGRIDEAIAELQKAIELDPKLGRAHINLGSILCDVKHDYDGAIVCFQKALELDPKDPHAHTNLGSALHPKGRVDEAIAEYQKALELDPKFADAHINLGLACYKKGRLEEAIAEWRKALELDPKNVSAHNNLGTTLHTTGRVDEAIAEFHKALELEPKCAPAHTNLGLALLDKGRLEEAIVQCKKALELDPKLAPARGILARWEPAAALLSKLPAFLQGEFQPRDNAQRLHLAQLCEYKKYHRAAAQLYADAFAAESKLADDLNAQHRYNAACCAALAAAGQGEDAAKLDSKERARWLKQALDWLRADLTAYGKLLDGGKPQVRTLVQQRLQHWQHDADLSGLRDKDAVAQLPADERQACERLWADVAALSKKAGQQK
jgi:Flp pilus assembly protein TadD